VLEGFGMMRGAARRQEIERAMRAHPAGRALQAGPGAPRTPLRLTARGRRLVAVLALAATVGLAALVGGLVAGRGPEALHLAGQSSVVVQPGDTLWSIASSVAGDEDVRAVVDRIQRVNGLRDSEILPGEVLRLP
jgi:nucleoid-associated protein YgaU